jgi:hypothetical protein
MVSEGNMNRQSKAFVAGFMSGILAPFFAMSNEPARRINTDAIRKASPSVQAAWRSTGNYLYAAMKKHDRSNGSKAA